jgi:hypothetical protein
MYHPINVVCMQLKYCVCFTYSYSPLCTHITTFFIIILVSVQYEIPRTVSGEQGRQITPKYPFLSTSQQPLLKKKKKKWHAACTIHLMRVRRKWRPKGTPRARSQFIILFVVALHIGQTGLLSSSSIALQITAYISYFTSCAYILNIFMMRRLCTRRPMSAPHRQMTLFWVYLDRDGCLLARRKAREGRAVP